MQEEKRALEQVAATLLEIELDAIGAAEGEEGRWVGFVVAVEVALANETPGQEETKVRNDAECDHQYGLV